ncbi:hypothetical protein [Massilia yuzhufengensis]|uniref:Heparinase II/III-like protein n=1 Tax=Massilia yuzhufengensis TaxID=1164594 RepID=A0A1I1GE09_9BURK|nr:hypothetical protein [Massilia yuzhufengensis]SFC07583.1 hypothetical protein SAMN05216204_103218 [Massilia yuzhufengensis]
MRHALPLLAAASLLAAPAHATPPLQRSVAQAYPQLETLFQKLVKEREGTTIEGRESFKAKDKFLPGKVATGLADLLLHLPKDDPRLPGMLRDYADLADLTVGMDNETWGIYYYIGALHRLKQAGLLERAVRPATLDKLRKQLDWRSFVRVPSYELVSLPTNYYGVAFSIARLRMLMGWEDTAGSEVLLDKMMKHYAAYSGEYGFSDETDGQGRFDRYSILLAAEICERFIETGLEVTPELKALLRRSAEVALNSATADGTGFTMGRSLGPYGETAMLEILSTAAYLGVLSPEEKEYAYAYSARIAERYMRFWYNPAMRSVDMWNGGRRTDTYRGKHRILGENFSLLHQLIATNEMWNKAGMKDVVPRKDLAAWLERTRPAFSLTRFARGEHDRALAIWRDKGHVFSLSVINGGQSQHANSPYYPLPFAHNIVAGVADSGHAHPQLMPKFTLADGSELMATAWMKDIQAAPRGRGQVLSYRQDALTLLGKNLPVKDARIRVETEYSLQPGAITRTDRYTPSAPLEVSKLTLEFGSFSSGATIEGGKVRFKEGAVQAFEVDGLAACTAQPAAGSELYRAPYGQMNTVVSCSSGPFSMREPLVVSWTIRYQ